MATSRPIATSADVQKVRDILITHRDKALFELGIHLAFRASDLLRITIGQVADKPVGTRIILRELKTTRIRSATLNEQCVLTLAPLIEERRATGAVEADPLFVAARGNTNKPLTVCSLSRLWHDWCSLARLPLEEGETWGSHTGRKTKGHVLRREHNMPLEVLQHVLGHTSIQVTAHYLHIEREEVASFYNQAI